MAAAPESSVVTSETDTVQCFACEHAATLTLKLHACVRCTQRGESTFWCDRCIARGIEKERTLSGSPMNGFDVTVGTRQENGKPKIMPEMLRCFWCPPPPCGGDG